MKKRILIVDDEPSIVKILGRLLQLEGFDVITAPEGKAGLAVAMSEHPDLIVMDLMLPNINGVDICRTLKKDAQYRGIQIVIFTGRGHLDDEKICKEAGAAAVFGKTDPPMELIGRIKQLLS